MEEFVTIGEPMVVYSSQDVDVSLDNAVHFTRYTAGAELNVSIGLSLLQHKSTYLTALGEDSNGRFLAQRIKEHGIDSSYIVTNAEARTGIYFKERVSTGDPQVEYARKNSAASQLSYQQLPTIDFTNVKVLHLTGISIAISSTMFRTVDQLIIDAHRAGVLVIFDPNIRKQLWRDNQTMARGINRIAAQCDVILPGMGEGELLTGSSDPELIADFYLNLSAPKLVVVKNGSIGAFAKDQSGKVTKSAAFKVKNVVDTVGAGDGFAAGLISGILEELPLSESLRRANAVGAFAVQHEGDSSGYPTKVELSEFLKHN